MKWLSGTLTFFNAATCVALLAGIFAHGLSRPLVTVCILAALLIGFFAYRTTTDVPLRAPKPPSPPDAPPPPKSKRAQRRAAREGKIFASVDVPRWSYRSIWFWLLAACFAMFALRSFCWLIYWDGNDVKVQSPNNLGDLSLHLTYITHFASGVPLWPDNPIEPYSKLRYPAGVDIFNALLTLLGLDVIRGLVWVGIIASIVTFYAFYRWGGNFGIAAFLFNGGMASYPVLRTFQFLDYQGANNIAWKSIALSMFVTQRGVLYAFPVALVLLYQWRARAFPEYTEPARLNLGDDETATPPIAGPRRPPLPFWVEVSLYATMPLYHAHTFMALSLVLAFLFVLGDWEIKKSSLLLVGLAVVPATFCVWITTDYFHASSFIKWQPGWVQTTGDMKMPFPIFWFVNFGAWVPLVLFFIGVTGLTIWKQSRSSEFKISAAVGFLIPAIAIFLIGNLVKLAPWEWDNIKIIVWAYFIILPFLWTDLIAHWPVSLRAVVFIALFVSGFVTLLGGLAAGKNGFGIANREELDAVGVAVRKLPADARYAGWPTWGHPVLLQGRKMVLGYPGHLWTQGFNYGPTNDKLQAMMLGAPNWKQLADELHARYLFWGREEKTNYAASKRPWEHESALIANGEWGSIYDVKARPNPATQAPASVPRQ